jgi:hypothetical protein
LFMQKTYHRAETDASTAGWGRLAGPASAAGTSSRREA